jgi:hypothetical protein
MNKISYNIKIEPDTIYELSVDRYDQQILNDIAFSFKSRYIVYAAKTAMPKKGVFGLFGKANKCDLWLASEGGIDLKTAQQTIETFPLDVHPRLDHNAMNPRKFLGIAAAFAKKPDIIIFETAGMDPLGVEQLNYYIKLNINQHFIIEVCWPGQ